MSIMNPTIYPAEVRIFAETSEKAQASLLPTSVGGMKSVRLNPGETKEVEI